MLRPDPLWTDVTSFPEYNFQSFSGTVWKTKVKLALADVRSYHKAHGIMLLTPDAFDPRRPGYTPPPAMEKLIGEVPAGSRVRIGQLMKDNGIGSVLRVTATLEDRLGTYSLGPVRIDDLDPDLLAKNRFIWLGWSNSEEWGANPDMLERAE